MAPSTAQSANDEEPAGAPESTRGSQVLTPLTDIYETESSLILLFEMPGVGPESVNVALNGRVLTVSGETGIHPPTGYTLTHEEFRPAHYERALTLADVYEDEDVVAVMNDGVLNLTIANAPKKHTRAIPVQRG